MALPLIAIAASVLPELVRILAGDRAGTATAQVAAAVQTITGTDDPAAAQAVLGADPAKTTELRIRLAEIALDQQRAQLDAEDKRRQAELEELKTRTADTQSARGTLANLVGAGSSIAWGAPVISLVVTVGFFGCVIALMTIDFTGDPVDVQFRSSLLNIVVGALVAAFTAVVNFWIGSSQGSRQKDEAVQALQEKQSAQSNQTIQGLQAFAQSAIRSGTPGAATADPRRRENSFAACLDVVLAQEGGFSDHPEDRGGPTMLGITLQTLQDFRGKPVTAEDVRALTREEATEIYRANYWNVMRCNDLPPGIDLMVFDFGVNAGPRTSIKALQRAAGVTDDGSVGPITLAAVKAADPAALVAAFAKQRMEHYRALENFPTFGRGWTSRTEAVTRAALQMAGTGSG